MSYTIYLFGYKFMVRWNENKNLSSTEYLIQKALWNEFTDANEIIEISEQSIYYVDRNYNFKTIHWTTDTLFIKSKPLNKSDLKINITNLEFLIVAKNNVLHKSFEELDLNNDKTIKMEEMEDISVIKIEYILSSENQNLNSQLLLNISM